jgi:fluoroquinolone transport system permease protein
MSAIGSIVLLDVRGILRDNVMYINVGMSVSTVAIITVLGAYQDHLPGWYAWFPLMIALALVGGPGGFGVLFGMLMVDESDSGVRQALVVTPVPPTTLILTRTLFATLWMCVWPALTLTVMNAAWQALDLALIEWAVLIVCYALLTPALALAIPTLAADKVEALAVFKGLSFISLIPLALYFIGPDAWYRGIFLLSPTGWGIEAFDAFRTGSSGRGYAWAGGGVVYALLLLGVAIHYFRRNVYRLST